MSVAAVVLAAGSSQRLGQPKQLLRREDETLLRRAARLALASGAAQVCVALGAQSALLRPELHGLVVDVVEVPDWAEGMGASLRQLQRVLHEARHRHVLILGCDQPALRVTHLLRLQEAARSAAAGSAFSAYAGVRGLPAVVAWPLWQQARFAGDEGLRALARDLATQGLAEVAAPELALDLDTPADVSAAISLGWLDRLD